VKRLAGEFLLCTARHPPRRCGAPWRERPEESARSADVRAMILGRLSLGAYTWEFILWTLIPMMTPVACEWAWPAAPGRCTFHPICSTGCRTYGSGQSPGWESRYYGCDGQCARRAQAAAEEADQVVDKALVGRQRRALWGVVVGHKWPWWRLLWNRHEAAAEGRPTVPGARCSGRERRCASKTRSVPATSWTGEAIGPRLAGRL